MLRSLGSELADLREPQRTGSSEEGRDVRERGTGHLPACWAETVFFASAVVGSAMPNLTYMLAFPDEAGRKAAWDRFRGDDAWLKLKAIPEYADKEIVSKITNKILAPASYSEI